VSEREYAMNTTGMAAAWRAEADEVATRAPDAVAAALGVGAVLPLVGRMGGLYNAEYTRTGVEPVAYLKRVRCLLPPVTPQMGLARGDAARLQMPDLEDEIAVRLREWAEVAAAES
jgi:hypothetical protein